MKKLMKSVSLLCIGMIVVGMTSCAVGLRTDNGRHRGWFQNRHRDDVIIIDKDVHHRRPYDIDRR
ncbi:MAG: hypothetical protein WCK78_18325 [Paludibacter sp.]